ncbi:D(1)-like dopamine receptor [Paramacrobiotus metropolitanus]|uniref:D(1)-like dopamine receptor n=1 Tax=Paramacrobiotus metropolitanus TaxID=2943436 RepID=UPI002445B756|nr:D(1)-like dopamine receptor [Paramacrobiotus metropolitanus]
MQSFWNATTIGNSANTSYNLKPAITFRQGWTPPLIGFTCISSVSFILNVIVLILQFLPQTQVTPFTIYLIVIFVYNAVSLAVVRPISTFTSLFGVWPGGHALCVTYMYFQRVASVIPVLAHVLISMDRLWAIRFPLSYRLHHQSKLTVIAVCFAMLGYVHVVPFPAFLIDFLYYNSQEKQRTCQQITGSVIPWNRADFILHRLLPLIMIVSIYVYIIVKRWQRKRITTTNGPPNESSREQQPTDPAMMLGDVAGVYGAGANVGRVQHGLVIRRRRRVKPFIVLTMTSISVLICWIPTDVYWFAMAYLDIRMSGVVFTVTTTLYSIQMIFDPLMWFFSLR